MAKLAEARSGNRETAILYRGRALVVKLRPRWIELREKGRRDVVSMSYDAIYEWALKRRWQERRAAR